MVHGRVLWDGRGVRPGRDLRPDAVARTGGRVPIRRQRAVSGRHPVGDDGVQRAQEHFLLEPITHESPECEGQKTKSTASEGTVKDRGSEKGGYRLWDCRAESLLLDGHANRSAPHSRA